MINFLLQKPAVYPISFIDTIDFMPRNLIPSLIARYFNSAALFSVLPINLLSMLGFFSSCCGSWNCVLLGGMNSLGLERLP